MLESETEAQSDPCRALSISLHNLCRQLDNTLYMQTGRYTFACFHAEKQALIKGQIKGSLKTWHKLAALIFPNIVSYFCVFYTKPFQNYPSGILSPPQVPLRIHISRHYRIIFNNTDETHNFFLAELEETHHCSWKHNLTYLKAKKGVSLLIWIFYLIFFGL